MKIDVDFKVTVLLSLLGNYCLGGPDSRLVVAARFVIKSVKVLP